MFARRVAILGTGLIGGSLGLALRAGSEGLEVVGHDIDPAAAATAVVSGAVSRTEATAMEAVEAADLVVLAVPVDQSATLCHAVAPALSPDAVVTDVGSAKLAVVEAGESSVGPRFVGGHPMAGSERHGIGAAEAELFQDAWWILTPTERTSSDAYNRVASLATAVGARPVAVEPHLHDELVARLSHLPQLTASALVEVAASEGDRNALLGLAAGGFRDVTRIAASHPDLWTAILKVNRPAVLAALAALNSRLSELAIMIEGEDWPGVWALLERARAARLELFAKAHLPLETVTLSLLIPDRPGVLAEVTTAAGRVGANIEDIRIVHSTEGARGRLDLVVGRGPATTALVSALEGLGYHVAETDFEGT